VVNLATCFLVPYALAVNAHMTAVLLRSLSPAQRRWCFLGNEHPAAMRRSMLRAAANITVGVRFRLFACLPVSSTAISSQPGAS